jgi:hypothetical protein
MSGLEVKYIKEIIFGTVINLLPNTVQHVHHYNVDCCDDSSKQLSMPVHRLFPEVHGS